MSQIQQMAAAYIKGDSVDYHYHLDLTDDLSISGGLFTTKRDAIRSLLRNLRRLITDDDLLKQYLREHPPILPATRHPPPAGASTDVRP